MPEPLALVLVSSSTAGYLTGLATRDSPFAFGVYYAFWLIFAFTYYVNLPETPENIFFYVPIIVALATIVGVIISKLLNIGQLVDVWVTGSGGGSNPKASRYEELNMPLMPLAILFAFFTVFFAVAAVSCGSDSLTCASFLNGIWSVSSWTVGWLLFGVFLALTLLAFFASGIQTKYGGRHKQTTDYASLLYTFLVLGAITFPILMWHLAPSSWSRETIGWVSAIVAIVSDLILFGIGCFYEHWLDKSDGGNMVKIRNGRFYSIEGSGTRLFFRFLFVILVHAGAFVLGGYAVVDSASDVAVMFWPWFVAYYGVAFLFFGTLYAVIFVLFSYQDMMGTLSDDDDDVKTALNAEKYSGDEESDTLTASSSTNNAKQNFDFDFSPVATRTRRRNVSTTTRPNHSSSSKLDFD